MHIHMQKTRQEIVEILKRRGEATVEELSTQLGLTPTCIRQHVAVLERDGMIDSREVRRKVGRPHYVFSLTAQADAVFPQHYDLLGASMLSEIRASSGAAGVQAMVEKLADRLAVHFEGRIRDNSFAQSVENLITVLDELGVMPELQSAPSGSALVPPHHRRAVSAGAADSGGDSADDGFYSDDNVYIIRETNCPFRRISQEHPELCGITQHFIARTLDAEVQRLDNEPGSGGEIHPCTYRITPRSARNGSENRVTHHSRA